MGKVLSWKLTKLIHWGEQQHKILTFEAIWTEPRRKCNKWNIFCLAILVTVHHLVFLLPIFQFMKWCFLDWTQIWIPLLACNKRVIEAKTKIGILLKSTFTLSWHYIYPIESAKIICPFFYSIRTFKIKMMRVFRFWMKVSQQKEMNK